MIKYFICDVDGCLNDGVIYWGDDGKKFKAFGNYDHDGLKLLKKHVDIKFITADKAGWHITKSRIVDHMKYELHLVNEDDRYRWVSGLGFEKIAYMGDGIFDAPIIKEAALGIAPAQARVEAKLVADYVTPNNGGQGAVMDACMFILDKLNINHGF